MRRAEAFIGTGAFLLLAPGVVAGLIPWFITRWRVDATPLWASALGVLLLLCGGAILLDSFLRFAREGRGTPAPVAPTERLVVTGFYRHVRNPMYVAVTALILAQVLLFQSAALTAYLIVVWTAFHLFVVFYEEPTLKRAFPDDYARYAANVPRWLPRLSAWRA